VVDIHCRVSDRRTYSVDVEVLVDEAVDTHLKFNVDVLCAQIMAKVQVDAVVDILVETGVNVYVEMMVSGRADAAVDTYIYWSHDRRTEETIDVHAAAMVDIHVKDADSEEDVKIEAANVGV